MQLGKSCTTITITTTIITTIIITTTINTRILAMHSVCSLRHKNWLKFFSIQTLFKVLFTFHSYIPPRILTHCLKKKGETYR